MKLDRRKSVQSTQFSHRPRAARSQTATTENSRCTHGASQQRRPVCQYWQGGVEQLCAETRAMTNGKTPKAKIDKLRAKMLESRTSVSRTPQPNISRTHLEPQLRCSAATLRDFCQAFDITCWTWAAIIGYIPCSSTALCNVRVRILQMSVG